MTKKPTKQTISGKIKMIIPAGQANPAPPIGSSLGQKGISAVNFCKEFNSKTSSYKPGERLRVEVFVYQNKSFSFTIKEPRTADLIKEELNIKKCSPTPGIKTVAKLTKNIILKIAQRKIIDMNTIKVESAIKMIESTAKAMGIEVVNE